MTSPIRADGAVPGTKAPPLTPLQQGMLAHQLRAPGSGVDIEQVVVTLPESVDARAMAAAWQALVSHYDVLRTAFAWEGLDAPEQRVLGAATLPLEERDWTRGAAPAGEVALASSLRDESANSREAMLKHFLREDRLRGIDLRVAPLMRVTLGRWSANEAVLVWTFHHALLDGRCFPVMLREAFATYEAISGGHATPPLPARAPFATFARWVAERDAQASDAFWRAMLGDLASPTPIPVARTVPASGEAVQGDAERWIDAALVSRLRAVAAVESVTLNTVVQGAWALVLARYSGADDVTFGVTRAGRRNTVPDADEMLGLFITTVPLRLRMSDAARTGEWLRSIRAAWQALAEHEHTPLPRIQAASAVAPGRALFESIVMFEQYELDTRMRAEGGGWAARTVRLHEQNGFPLTLAAYADERMLLRLEFDRTRFDDETVVRMLGHLATALAGLAAAPERVGAIEIVSAEERASLMSLSSGATMSLTEETLAHLLAAQARATPGAVAVEDARRTMTYAQLESATCALARSLRAHGVGTGVRVGVAAERSVELVVALLAVVRAGGAYVPIDPEYPSDRVRFMLDDAQVPVLLTSALVAPTLPPHGARVLLLDGVAEAEDAGPALPMPAADDPAYMIYTSGSTGRPKGALNAHRGIVNRLRWMQGEYQLTARDVVLQKTPFSFDVSVWEFFWPLMAGARLVMAKPGGHREPQYLAEVMVSRGVTVCHFVPSMLRAFLSDAASRACTSLRAVMASGEALAPDVVATFYAALPDARLHNLYGPTECAVDVSYWPCPPSPVPPPLVPIGRPVANTRLYVLDARGWLCPISVPGELFLAGVQVGLGYHNRPELTAERFVADPFAPASERSARMYRTGDQARWRADGTVEYLGRLDFQVKIRGFRIELGEIEAALLAHAHVADAVVSAHGASGEEKRLVAYVVARGSAPASGELRAHLLETLPDYMVPALFVWLDALPLSSNGKVDRRALPEPEAARPDAARVIVAPRTSAETALATVWASVLRMAQVGVEDNFFELGGDSLLAIQVISRAARDGYALTLTEALKHPTVAAQARVARVASSRSAGARDEAPVPAGTAVALTPVQAWFAELDPLDPQHWNQGWVFDLVAELDVPTFERAVRALAAHHDAFRLRFVRDGSGSWRQHYAADGAVAVDVVALGDGDASSEAEALGEGDASNAITAAADTAQRALELADGPLVRVVVMTQGGTPVRVALVAHHLVVDGVSWRVLREDLDSAYEQIKAGKTPVLGASARWRSWSEALVREAASPRLAAELPYWAAQVAPGTLALPVAHDDAPNVEGELTTVKVRLNAEETSALLQRVPAAYGTRVNDALLAALEGALASWLGDGEVLVDMEGHGREDMGVDVARTVGWFTSVFPVRVACKRGATPRERLIAAKERLRALPRQGVGFGLLRYLGAQAALADGSSAPILFNYLGQFDQVVEGSSLFRFARESAGAWRSARARRRHEIEINGDVQGGALAVRIAYAAARHDASVMTAFASAFGTSLRAIITHATAPEAGGYTPSDFPLAALDQPAIDHLLGTTRRGHDVYPLTPVQRLFLDGAGAPGDTGFQQYLFTLDGSVDEPALRAAWEAVIAAHPAFRTRFVRGAPPLQVVEGAAVLPWSVIDAPADATSHAAWTESWLAADRKLGFDPSRAPLMRVALLRLTPTRTQLVWTQHHLILDRWSWPRVLRQVGAQYAARRAGTAVPALTAPAFRDAVAAIIAPPSSATEQYWRAELAEMTHVARLLGAPAGDAAAEAQWRDEVITLDADATARLVREARRMGVSVNTLLQGAWALALARTSGTLDVSFGLAVAGRAIDVAMVDEIVGVLINNVPVRAKLGGNERAAAWLAALQARQADMRAAEQVSPEALQQWSGLAWGQRLFESLVVFQDDAAESGQRDWLGASLMITKAVTPTATALPLTLLVTGTDTLTVTMRCDVRWVAPDLGAALASQLAAALHALGSVGDSTLAQLLAALPPAPEGILRAVERAPIVFPRDDVERVLARQWATLLGLEVVGVTESFLALGGSSLAATQAIARVRESFQVDVPVRALFESPTVESFARVLVARERKRGQMQRIAQLILRVEDMSADELRASASPHSQNPVPVVPT